MKLLLDTHAWLWWIGEPERLGPEAASLIADRRNDVYLSAASSWEIAIKVRLGKLTLPEPPAQFVPSRMERDGIAALPISHPHALAVSSLPMHHRDPFDRMLIAQSRVEGIPIVTAGPEFGAYDVELIPADR